MSLPVFTHSACLEHDTGAGHFERPQRRGAVIDALRTGRSDGIDWRAAPRATRGRPLPSHCASMAEPGLETRAVPHVHPSADKMMTTQAAEAAICKAASGVGAVVYV